MSILTPSPIDTLAKLLINRDFGFLWMGQTISGVGDFFFDTTLILFWKLGSIYGVIVLQSCCAQFFSPARLALTADIVPDADEVIWGIDNKM